MRERDVPSAVMDHIVQVCADELEAERGFTDPTVLERYIREVVDELTPGDIKHLRRKLDREERRGTLGSALGRATRLLRGQQ